MKVCVLGLGRSGTTALYELCRKIMGTYLGPGIVCGYEPFLRDSRFLDGPYEQVAEKSRYIDSLSIEGLYHHLTMPLLIPDPAPFTDNPYLRSLLYPADGTPHVLLKFIRANGRYLLLKRLCPECRTIFIIRNPVDTVHSVLLRFSFFGGEFHRDDFARFLAEVNGRYGTAFSPAEPRKRIEKELLYWYYMNRFALESFAGAEKRPLILSHEEYSRQRAAWVKVICDFLGVDSQPGFALFADDKVGPVTDDFTISAEEYDLYRHYLDVYTDMLRANRIDFSFKPDDIFKKYRVIDGPIVRDIPFYGLHTRALDREYRLLLEKKEAELAEKDRVIAALREKLARSGLDTGDE